MLTEKNEKRQAYIDGLHQIADFLTEHPEVPLPYLGGTPALAAAGADVPTIPIYLIGQGGQRDSLAAVARAMGTAQKTTDPRDDQHARFYVWRQFAGIALVASAERDEVCERVVTGTREVTTEMPDPEALAAVPKVTVTKIVEDVDWVCAPLLKTTGSSLLEVPGGESE